MEFERPNHNIHLKFKLMKVCGLDVHKDSIFCAIYDGKKYKEVKIFGTLTRDIRELTNYLQDEQVSKVAMESTGCYWIPI